MKRSGYQWLLATSLAVGLATGLLGVAFYYVTVRLIWGRFLPALFGVGVFFIPAVGLLFGGLMLYFGACDYCPSGSDSVLEAYHDPDRRFSVSKAPWKAASSIPVIGLGGSAGISGPLIYMGAVVAQVLHELFDLDPEKKEVFQALVISGAAAGFATAFRAPIAGAFFAIELPEKKGYSGRLFLPALVSSLSAYSVTYLAFGYRPLFLAPGISAFTAESLFAAVAVGFLCGLMVRLFGLFFEAARESFESGRVTRYLKTFAGGVAVGFAGFLGILLTGAPVVLGPGYEGIRFSIALLYGSWLFALVVFLKAVATVATLASGAFGGLIEPQLFMGSATGGLIAQSGFMRSRELVPVIGLGAFLAGGFNLPVTAAVLAVEVSAAPAALLPAFIAAAVAWAASGWDSSLLRHQR
ncbi:MAG: chloride channel protein [Candidatus Aquicultorales bacterium]